MGKDLALGEYVLGANIDSKYMIYENLALLLETGWANYGNPNGSIWNTATRRFTKNVNDAWMTSFSFKYTLDAQTQRKGRGDKPPSRPFSLAPR